jgi:hypothetical protein
MALAGPADMLWSLLIIRPYHGEHGPKVLVTMEYIVLQRVLRKRECMSILTKSSKKHASYFKWSANQSYLNNFILNLLQMCKHC